MEEKEKRTVEDSSPIDVDVGTAADVEAGHRFVKENYDIHLIWQTIDDLLKRGRTR